MLRKILLIAAIALIVIVVGVELYSPSIIKEFVGRELEDIGVTDFEMALTSKRPYLLRLLNNDLSARIVIEEYNSAITFQRIEAQFTGYGIEPGDISFKGIVAENEVNKLIKAQWGEELNVVLTKGFASVSMPVNLYFVQLNTSIKGVFNVNDNNEVVFDIKSVDINIPGFEKNVEEFLFKKSFQLNLQHIPNIQFQKIEIEEGYLEIYGIIR